MKPSSYSEHKLQTIASYQQFLEQQSSPAYPLEIFLEISNVCNLKCAMCVVFSELNPHRLQILKSEDRGFLDKSLIEALDPLLSHALMVHCFGYGEPTVHPDFANLLASIAHYEVLVDFFTNGMNLSEELCEFLVERQIHKITVSFSGSTKEDYENMYLNGRFETVLGGIARLDRIKNERGSRYPLIDINSIAFPHHLERIVEFVELMAERGVSSIQLKPHVAYEALPVLHSHVAVMRPWVEGQWLDQAKQLAQRKGLSFLDEFSNVAAVGSPEEEEAMRARLMWGNAGKSETAIPIADLKKKAKTVEPIIPPKSPQPRPLNPATAMIKTPDTVTKFLGMGAPETIPDVLCSEPFKTFYVTQAGLVKPCCFGMNTYLGDLRTHDGASIWKGIGFATARDGILEGKYPLNICKACIQLKTYPKSTSLQSFLQIVTAYEQWYQSFFAKPLGASLQFAQLYVDTGEGFIERQSLTQWIAPQSSHHALEFKLHEHSPIKAIRFDPLNLPTAVTLHKALAYDTAGREYPLRYMATNMLMQEKGSMVFIHDDPQILLGGFPSESCESLVLFLSYHPEQSGTIQNTLESSPYYAQLFIDTGQGFNESESLLRRLVPADSQQDIEFDLNGFPAIHQLRFDPINAPAAIQIHSAIAIDESGQWQELTITQANPEEIQHYTLVFRSNDPQMLLAPLIRESYRWLRFSITYTLISPQTPV